MNPPPIDLAQIDLDLREVAANVEHASAQHNPWTLLALDAALRLRTEVGRLRRLEDADPEPRHQPEWDGLPFDERARRQAAWLNARGKDVCPVCLGFRENGVCPGAHDEAATATRPLPRSTEGGDF